MTVKKDFNKAEKLEKREAKWLKGESSYISNFRDAIKNRDNKKAKNIIKRLVKYQEVLERYHIRVLRAIIILEEDFPHIYFKESIEQYKNKIHNLYIDSERYFKKDYGSIAKFSTQLNSYVDDNKWKELSNALIIIEKSIRDWISLDKQLIEFEKKMYEQRSKVTTVVFEAINKIDPKSSNSAEIQKNLLVIKSNIDTYGNIYSEKERKRFITPFKKLVISGFLTVTMAITMLTTVGCGKNEVNPIIDITPKVSVSKKGDIVSAIPMTGLEKTQPQKEITDPKLIEEYKELKTEYQTTGKINIKLLSNLYWGIQARKHIKESSRNYYSQEFFRLAYAIDRKYKLRGQGNATDNLALVKMGVMQPIKKYNKAANSIVHPVTIEKSQCYSSSILTVLTYFNIMARHLENISKSYRYNYIDPVVFIYTDGHVLPGTIVGSKFFGTESTDKGKARIDFGTKARLKQGKNNIYIVKADKAIACQIALAFKDKGFAKKLEQDAFVFKHIPNEGTYSEASDEASGTGFENPFAFGKSRQLEGDFDMESNDSFQPFSALPVYSGASGSAKPDTEVRQTTEKLTFNKSNLSEIEQKKCLKILSAYLRWFNDNNVGKTNYIDANILGQVNNMGFTEASYILEKQDRINFMSKSFGVFLREAKKFTGKSSFGWKEGYDEIAKAIDRYLK